MKKIIVLSEIRVDYDTLVKVFGEPHSTGGYTCKTDAEWGFDFDGVIATIYNWKNGKMYMRIFNPNKVIYFA